MPVSILISSLRVGGCSNLMGHGVKFEIKFWGIKNNRNHKDSGYFLPTILGTKLATKLATKLGSKLRPCSNLARPNLSRAQIWWQLWCQFSMKQEQIFVQIEIFLNSDQKNIFIFFILCWWRLGIFVANNIDVI